jgi:choline dehydrogenase
MTAAEFDFILVGGGSAGSVLAHRLSDAGCTVCVLEAGPRDTNPYIHIPAGFTKTLHDPSVTWRFESEPGEWTGGRRVPAIQGKTLGGSGSVNGMVFIRGQSSDYDTWRQKGNRGWSYLDVLPYFKRLERRIGVADETYRGRDGNLPVTDCDWKHPLCEAFIAGAESLGYPRNVDYNAANQFGAGYYQRAINGSRRVSAARAFLYPAMKTGRVDVRTGAQASGIIFEGRRAVGLRYRRGEQVEVVRARREVIVCAGAINSPKLLQLSGIGPATLLYEQGIEVRHPLPGVGENLRDHFSPRIVARAKNIKTINDLVRGPRLLGELAKWALKRPSVLGVSAALAYAFGMSDPAMDEPDYSVVFAPASTRAGFLGALDDFPGMTCGAWQQRPESAGYVRIRSADPADAPLIQPNYLSAENDRRVLLAALRAARRILATPHVAQYYAREELPGIAVQSDSELLDFARSYGSSSFHFVGSCRMGPEHDPTAVVDDQLRVRGMESLRVIDSSVMPSMVSANTYATSLMIAEKGADMILGRAAPARVEAARPLVAHNAG